MSVNLQVFRWLSVILPNYKDRKIVILTGARQTGKTTLAKNKFADLKYLNLDAPENREYVSKISSFQWGEQIGDSVIDEAQKEPLVFEKLKFSFDDHSVRFSLLLGSSQILLLKKIRESLAGRSSIYELFPLMFSEFLYGQNYEGTKKPLISRIINSDSIVSFIDQIPVALLPTQDDCLKNIENNLLNYGGMPALLPLSDIEKRKWLKDYEYTYLERDLADLSRLDDLGPFRKFQKIASLRVACLLNYSELARDTGISTDTARRYLEYLRLSYQVLLLQPYYKNLTSSVVKTPKLIWIDNGLCRQAGSNWSDESGQLYENMVISEIYKWTTTMQEEVQFYFYRTRSGREVDLLLETSRGLIGFEIKSSSNCSKKYFSSLLEIRNQTGKKWLGGFVVYRGDKIINGPVKDLWAIPARRLLS